MFNIIDNYLDRLEAEQRRQSRSSGLGIVSTIAISAVVGFAVASLVNPNSGAKNRKNIQKEFKKVTKEMPEMPDMAAKIDKWEEGFMSFVNNIREEFDPEYEPKTATKTKKKPAAKKKTSSNDDVEFKVKKATSRAKKTVKK